MGMADDFIESVVTASCQLAKHRKSNTLETKDLQLHLGMYMSSKISPYQTVSSKIKKKFSLPDNVQKNSLCWTCLAKYLSTGQCLAKLKKNKNSLPDNV